MSEHVTVERFSGLVDGRLAPAPGVVTERAALGDWRIESRDFQIGVRRGRTVPLLSDQPRRGYLTRKRILININNNKFLQFTSKNDVYIYNALGVSHNV